MNPKRKLTFEEDPLENFLRALTKKSVISGGDTYWSPVDTRKDSSISGVTQANPGVRGCAKTLITGGRCGLSHLETAKTIPQSCLWRCEFVANQCETIGHPLLLEIKLHNINSIEIYNSRVVP